jgi:hypothetical protein
MPLLIRKSGKHDMDFRSFLKRIIFFVHGKSPFFEEEDIFVFKYIETSSKCAIAP